MSYDAITPVNLILAGIERVMDHIAHSLSCDAAEVRRRNYYPEMTSKPAARPSITPYQMEVTDFILGDMTESLLQRCDYHARKTEVARWNARNALLKRGIAFSHGKFGISFTLTHLNQAGLLLLLFLIIKPRKPLTASFIKSFKHA